MPQWTTHTRDDTELALLDFGGSGVPVLLLHGLLGHAHEWVDTASWLIERHRVVAPDARGHGRSRRRPADVSPQSHVDDAIYLLERMSLSGVVVVGHSLGGRTGILLAAERPDLVRALVLVDSAPVGGPGVAEPAVAELAVSLQRWPASFPNRAAAIEFFGGPSRTADAWVNGLETRADGWWPCFDADVMTQTLREALEQPCWEAWDRVECSTMLVWAGHGAVGSRVAAAMAGRPRVRLVELRGARHDLHLHQPAQWRRVLLEFLDSSA